MKTLNTKLKLLCIRDYFRENSDADHGVTVREIQSELARRGLGDVERKSIYNDIATLKDYGMEIAHEEGSRLWFLTERAFEPYELKLLIDSVQSSKFLSEKDSVDLIDKLSGLGSVHFRRSLNRQIVVAGRVKSTNTAVFANVDWLNAAIAQDRQVRFRYFRYDVRKQKQYLKSGGAYTMSPWRLIYTDDNYYLLAYDEKDARFRHFRVDRMDRVQLADESRRGQEEFEKLDMADYTKYTFGMFGGEREDVTIEFENRMMNAVIDRFGRDVWVSRVDEDHFAAAVPVNVSPLFFSWLAAFGTTAKLVAPPCVRKAYTDYLDEVRKMYE